MTILKKIVWGVATVGLVAAGACKSDNPATPSPTPTTPPVATTTITITAAGVNPKDITVPRGRQVTFVNNDSVNHQMNSDPHPTHGDCAELDQVGFLGPGQSRQTGNLNTPRVCGFHDHLNDSRAALRGTVTIQ
jgi:plastocyanin